VRWTGQPDDEVTLDSVGKELIILGTPDRVAADILVLPLEVANLWHIALCRQGLAGFVAGSQVHDPGSGAGAARVNAAIGARAAAE
jgi:hypothetical protein